VFSFVESSGCDYDGSNSFDPSYKCHLSVSSVSFVEMLDGDGELLLNNTGFHPSCMFMFDSSSCSS